MTTSDAHPISLGDDRLLETLQRLLAIQVPELRPALTQASNLIGEALGADKVDVFLLERETGSLVAMGTSETELGARQYALGMHRQPLANGGPAAGGLHTGEPDLIGRADDDPGQLRGMVVGLGSENAQPRPQGSHRVPPGYPDPDCRLPGRLKYDRL